MQIKNIKTYLTLCIMTFNIIIYCNIDVVAQQADTKISITIPAGKLENAIKLLEQQHKVVFAYESSMFKEFNIEKLQFKNQKLSQILDELFQGTNLNYEERGNYIIIKKNEKPKPKKQPLKKGGTLSGYIEDPTSGERLVGVAIMGTNIATLTNNFGFYSLAFPNNEAHLTISYLGYKTIDTIVQLEGDTRINFQMPPEMNALESVVITANKTPEIQQRVQMSQITLSAEQIKSMPQFFGESDVMKTLQMMPGVQQGSEGTSALLVRGGSPDQNLILLDGATLYNPSHLLGIFSTFNTSVIKNVDLYKGAFPARFGGRLSSVIDIVTKDGTLNKIHGDLSIGLLASQLTLEGPIIKGKTSFVLSGRRSYTDLIARPFIKSNKTVGNLTLYFYDLNLKVQHVLSENDRLVLSLYGGNDKFGITRKADSINSNKIGLSWKNYSGTLRWNRTLSKNMFMNTTLIASNYGFITNAISNSILDGNTTKQSIEFNSGIRDYGIKSDLDYRPNPNHIIRAGISYVRHTFSPGISNIKSEKNGNQENFENNTNQKLLGTELDAYTEDQWTASNKLSINYGLHWSGFASEGKFYQSLQPRLSARYLLPMDWGLKLSYSRMSQYIHLLAGNSITLPTDLWVPATKNVLPQVANQYALGLARNIFKGKVEFSIETYYKAMNNVIEYKEGEEYLSTADKNWSDKIAAGKGKAYGMEIMFQKKEGRLTGWIAYTLSKTERTIPGINFDKAFPYKYDRRHDFKIVSIYQLTKGIEIATSWVYQSASPFTLGLGQYQGVIGYDSYNNPDNSLPNITSRNNFRIEDYHRLDLSLNFIKNKKNGIVRTWNISVYNVYNRKNPFMYYSEYNSPNNANELRRITLFSILPSISYSLKF